jgi:hypothetical protein
VDPDIHPMVLESLRAVGLGFRDAPEGVSAFVTQNRDADEAMLETAGENLKAIFVLEPGITQIADTSVPVHPIDNLALQQALTRRPQLGKTATILVRKCNKILSRIMPDYFFNRTLSGLRSSVRTWAFTLSADTMGEKSYHFSFFLSAQLSVVFHGTGVTQQFGRAGPRVICCLKTSKKEVDHASY